jgi:hypothetical protein
MFLLFHVLLGQWEVENLDAMKLIGDLFTLQCNNALHRLAEAVRTIFSSARYCIVVPL